MSAWIGLIAAIAVLLAVDLALARGRTMTTRAAALASVAWVGVSLAFFAVLLATGHDGAGAYLAGYLVEKSLSLDNVFVFLLIFTSFGIAVHERHRLLTYGIVGALVLRAVFIVAGAALLSAFGWVSFLFAALLGWTAWRLWRHRHDHGDSGELVERLRRRLPIAEDDGGGRRFVVREGGRRVLTVAGAALASIAIVDVLFAVDSVPAILAITDDAYIVFAANAFALLGLRPLFFLVADLVERLYYLKAALAALLGFIAAKMVWGELVGKVGPEVSLPVIAGILGTGAVASLVRDRRRRRVGRSPSLGGRAAGY
jgi:tellurite resistance protein TerC